MAKKKRLLVFILLLLLFSLTVPIGAFLIFQNRINLYATEALSGAAKKANINLKLEGLQIGPLGVAAKDINVFFPKLLLQLGIKDPHIRPEFFSFLRLNPTFTLNGLFFQSPLSASASYSIPAGHIAADFSVPSLSLTNVPQLAFLGINKGQLAFLIKDFKADKKEIRGFSGQLKLLDLSSSRELTIPARLKDGSKQPLIIPSVSDLDLNADFNYVPPVIKFSNGSIRSDLGSADFAGSLSTGPQGTLSSSDLKFEVNLSGKAMEYFGYLLPEISNNMIASNQSRFIITTTVVRGRLQLHFEPRSGGI